MTAPEDTLTCPLCLSPAALVVRRDCRGREYGSCLLCRGKLFSPMATSRFLPVVRCKAPAMAGRYWRGEAAPAGGATVDQTVGTCPACYAPHFGLCFDRRGRPMGRCGSCLARVFVAERAGSRALTYLNPSWAGLIAGRSTDGEAGTARAGRGAAEPSLAAVGAP